MSAACASWAEAVLAASRVSTGDEMTSLLCGRCEEAAEAWLAMPCTQRHLHIAEQWRSSRSASASMTLVGNNMKQLLILIRCRST